MTGAYDEYYVHPILRDQQVEVRVDESQARAGAPVTEKSGLDIIEREITLEEDIVS